MTTEEKITQLELENEQLQLRLAQLNQKQNGYMEGLWVLIPALGMISGIIRYLF